MTKIRLLLAGALALCLVAISAVTAVSASAHTPEVTHTCDSLSVQLRQYTAGNSDGTNRVTVTINGETVAEEQFDTEYEKDFSVADKTTSFSYEVVIEAWDDPDGSNGWSKTITGQSTPCDEPYTPPTGTFTVECTEAGAQADVGTLSEGSRQNGTFELQSDGGFAQPVTSGQQNVEVPAEQVIELVYVPARGENRVLDTKTAPEACGSEETPASGSFTVECVDDGALADVGELDEGSATGGNFRLLSANFSVPVTSGQQDVEVPLGQTIRLVYLPADGDNQELDRHRTPESCGSEETPAAGSFTTECTATAAQADIGTLTEGSATGGTFELRSGDTVVVVTSGQQDVPVPAGSLVELYYVPASGDAQKLDDETSPMPCPPTVPASGSFTPECTATAAQADVGTLTEGSATGGTFRLVSGGTSTTVTSGQQDVPVPASSTITLEYVPAQGAATVLDTEQSPAPCPASTPAPVRGLEITKAVSPTGSAQFGATLTYTLTVSATGNAAQTAVTVTDEVPAGTTFTTGSASCDGTCTTGVSNGTVSWSLGGMAAGTTRNVSFKVTVDTPEADADGAIPAVTIRNAAAVQSAEVPTTPSNEVETPVAAVQGTKTGNEGDDDTDDTDDNGTSGGDTPVNSAPTGTGVLAATGAGLPVGGLVTIAGLLILTGAALLVRPAGRHARR